MPNNVSGNVSVLLGDGAGGFGPPANFAVAQQPASVAVADFDKDGKADLAVGSGSAQIMLGNGAGGFSVDSERYLTGGGLLLAGDFDGDGKTDLASPRADVGIRPGVVALIFGRGDGTFDVSRGRRFNAGPSSLAVADFNGDGRADVTSTFSFSPSVGFVLGDGAGGLSRSEFYNGQGTPGWVATGDFDGDGRADAASANLGTGFGTLTVFYGDGAGLVARSVNVSAAFFLSIEFQETGYLVYRTFKTAYGDATSPGVPGTVPVVRLSEFLPDTRRIGEGVVGPPGWEATLEANKNAYTLEFVSRQRFADAYPAALTPAAFVDALYANAGVTPAAAERQAAIGEFGAATNTADAAARARVLRRIADNATLRQAEFNRAFVLMQYYGYLRRNPDDAPEPGLNFGGWKFWLDKLNEFGGNYVAAEMVKAFITSDEYRRRFQP